MSEKTEKAKIEIPTWVPIPLGGVIVDLDPLIAEAVIGHMQTTRYIYRHGLEAINSEGNYQAEGE